MWRTSGRWRWGFCSIRSWLAAYLRRVAALMMQFPPDWRRRGRGLRRCGRQSADPLGKKSPKTVVLTEWICVLGATVSVVAHCAHANPLLRVLTRYVARKPAMWSVGGAAQARISGLTCALAGPRAH